MNTPFWKSKTFWTMVVAFAVNVLPAAGVPITPTMQTAGSAILAVLGIIFRWTAAGPLSASSS